MPRVNLTRNLSAEYCDLYQALEIEPDRFAEVDGSIDAMVDNRSIYERVGREVNAPWYFVAAVHCLEASLDFNRHLHNGDPLTDRTRQVPAGRPVHGEPPFTWEESAVDALQLRRIDAVREWTLERVLYELEGYNGWGYRKFHPHVKSPYLWSYSNHYRSGKYVADGTWSDTAVSRQCGAAVLVKRLEQRGEIPVFSDRGAPRVTPLRFANHKVERADDLQRFLNTFPGISLRVDGWPGEKTSDAVLQVFGFRLEGDPSSNET